MTKYERSSRPDRPSPGRSADPMLDALLDGAQVPDEDPARWQPVARVLAALTSAPESSELAGEARALAEFRSRASAAPPRSRARRNRGWAASLRVPRPAVAAATGAAAMGGLLAVAYAGDLPAAAQRLAHDTIGAPAVTHHGRPGSGPAASPGPVSSRRPTAGQGSSPSSYGPARSDRRIARGHRSGSPYQRWLASSAPGGGASGRPGQYSPGPYSPGQYGPGQGTPGPGTPGQSPTPEPTQQPSPSASSSPPAGAAPSPSAAPSSSQQSRHHREPAPAPTQSFPP